MKFLFTALFICVDFCYTFSQEDVQLSDSCINFDTYNFCYAVDYRPRNEKVGTVCSLKDLMLNSSVEITNLSIYVVASGHFMPITNYGKPYNEKNLFYSLKKLTEKYNIANALITFDAKINLNGKEKKYPNIAIKKCEK